MNKNNERMNKVLAELKEYGRLKKELEDEIEKLQNECKEYMTTNELTELFNDDNSIVARYTEVSSRKFNSTEFKKDFLDIYNAYCKLSKSMRFTIN